MNKTELMFVVALVIALGAASSTGASARKDVYNRIDGIRADPRTKDAVPLRVNRRGAIRIARAVGMRDISVLRRTGRQWRLNGLDQRGRMMRVVISSVTGEVLRLTQNGDASGR
jgi:hypothetical protein